MHDIKLSIIIPCYNVDTNTFQRCLESLSFLPSIIASEIIIVDDGSTNPDIITFLQTINEENIHIVRQENMGPGGARNTGIDLAKGEYISFVDSDDYILYGPYIQILNIIEEKKPDILCHGCKSNYEGSATKYMMEHDINPCCWSYFIKRKTLDSLRFTPYIFHEDEEFCTRIHLLRAHLITLNYTAYHYHYRADSIIHNKSDEIVKKRYRDQITVLKNLLAYNVPTPHKAALKRRIHIIAMCCIVTLMRDSKQIADTRETLKNLKEIGLYPLPFAWHGIRYLFIMISTYFPVFIYILTPFVKLLFKIRYGTAQKGTLTSHADTLDATEPQIFCK